MEDRSPPPRVLALPIRYRKVSPDAVAISYALFWEEKQYWRLFTASFSHFEPLHLLFNAMATWSTRHVEPMLGSFRLLYLVSSKSSSMCGWVWACLRCRNRLTLCIPAESSTYIGEGRRGGE